MSEPDGPEASALESEIPAVPEKSGVDGKQVNSATDGAAIIAVSSTSTGRGLQPFHSSEVLRELTRPGGSAEVGMFLIYALVHRLETENQALRYDVAGLRREIAKLRETLDEERAELSKARSGLAAARVELASLKSVRFQQNISATLGSLLVGFGGVFFETSNRPMAVTMVVLGLILLIVSWFPPRKASRGT